MVFSFRRGSSDSGQLTSPTKRFRYSSTSLSGVAITRGLMGALAAAAFSMARREVSTGLDLVMLRSMEASAAAAALEGVSTTDMVEGIVVDSIWMGCEGLRSVKEV